MSVFDPRSAKDALNAMRYGVEKMRDQARSDGQKAQFERDQFFYTGRIGAYSSVLTLLEVLREEYDDDA